jgi:two-component system chemotaxis response regulator CheY
MAKGRVLIVDDHELDRRLSSLDLEGAGYVVSEAGDVDEALKRIERQTFDVIILDIKMPGVDGLTFLRNMRLLTKLEKTPVIMLTASDDIDDELQAMSGGAVSYLVKPSHRDTLLQEVQNAMAKAWPTS